jgi:hypothetical protein
MKMMGFGGRTLCIKSSALFRGWPVLLMWAIVGLVVPTADARASGSFWMEMGNAALTKTQEAVGWATKAADAAGTIPPLDPSDDGALPNYNPPGMPSVPISCGANRPDADISECHACYQKAHHKLNDLRRHFERLRQLYVETDDFVKAQFAFGDSVAGSAGVGALEWVHQRGKISQSFKDFRGAYTRKHRELLGRLEEVLREIAECERQFFGDEDWYNRYGFMFLTFMSMHYAR